MVGGKTALVGCDRAHVADSVLKWPALTCEICAQSTITPKPLICDVIKPVCPTLPPLRESLQWPLCCCGCSCVCSCFE